MEYSETVIPRLVFFHEPDSHCREHSGNIGAFGQVQISGVICNCLLVSHEALAGGASIASIMTFPFHKRDRPRWCVCLALVASSFIGGTR